MKMDYSKELKVLKEKQALLRRQSSSKSKGRKKLPIIIILCVLIILAGAIFKDKLFVQEKSEEVTYKQLREKLQQENPELLSVELETAASSCKKSKIQPAQFEEMINTIIEAAAGNYTGYALRYALPAALQACTQAGIPPKQIPTLIRDVAQAAGENAWMALQSGLPAASKEAMQNPDEFIEGFKTTNTLINQKWAVFYGLSGFDIHKVKDKSSLGKVVAERYNKGRINKCI